MVHSSVFDVLSDLSHNLMLLSQLGDGMGHKLVYIF